MQQIADWLEQLGLGQYAQRFAENDITVAILPDLTDQDLKELGVASLGHRRLLLRAIADLNRIEKSAPAVPAAATAAPLVPPSGPAPIPTTVAPAMVSAAVEGAGERRYLTVMFCDLVGSTSISAQLDAEEWRDLVGVYLDAASAAVAEMGGHVAKNGPPITQSS
jgi:SAM domain (Sterile alpha motif)